MSVEIRILEQAAGDPVWDAFLVGHPFGQHLQSSPWGQLKSKFGWQVIRVLVQEQERIVGGAQILTRSLPMGGKFGYIPKGPVVAPGRFDVMGMLLDAIEKLAQAGRFLILSIQPPVDEPLYMDPLRSRQFKPSSFYVTPATTVLVDLQQSEDDILAQMKRGTRYNVRLASRKGIIVQERDGSDLPLFYQWMEAAAGRYSYRYYDLPYYQEAWSQFDPHDSIKLLMAYYQDEPLAGVIVIALGNWAVYKWGASSGAHLNRKPNDLLQWAAMQWSKKKGCHYYDMGGITPVVAQALRQDQDPPPIKGANIARFKLGFGQMTTFPASYDNNYGWGPRWLVRNAISLAWRFDFVRKLAQGI